MLKRVGHHLLLALCCLYSVSLQPASEVIRVAASSLLLSGQWEFLQQRVNQNHTSGMGHTRNFALFVMASFVSLTVILNTQQCSKLKTHTHYHSSTVLPHTPGLNIIKDAWDHLARETTENRRQLTLKEEL